MNSNILLIVADSVRARNMSIYGHTERTTPFLDGFSQRATVYTQARSPGTWTLPSHTSMFTGYHVHEHGITSRSHRLREGNTIWEWLRNDCNYSTAVFSPNPFITTDRYGLQKGFGSIVSDLQTRRYPSEDGLNPETANRDIQNTLSNREYLRQCLRHDQPLGSIANGLIRKVEQSVPGLVPDGLQTVRKSSAAVYTSEFLAWAEKQEQPWAACINIIDAHDPYRPIKKFDKWGGRELRKLYNTIDDHRWDFYSKRRPWWLRRSLEALYDGCIRQIDSAIETLIYGLTDIGEFDETCIVLTADHGEGFGERSHFSTHRIAGHEAGVHEVLLHVPLLVKYPNQEDSAEITSVATLTQFPEVIRSVVSNDKETTDFIPDGPVVSSTMHHNRYAGNVTNFEDYRDEMDTTPFSGEGKVVYKDRDDGVIKYGIWNDQEATVQVRNAQEHIHIDGPAADQVESVFSSLQVAPVREQAGEQIDAETYDRLSDLGYI